MDFSCSSQFVFDTNNYCTLESHNSTSAITQNTKDFAVALFKERNCKDEALENKILYIQRFFRAKLRQDSEIVRISKLGLNAEEIFKDANTPYRPQKCSPELADRIVKAADQITLYTSVKHLASIANIEKILEGCLYGRDNLTRLGITFREAALTDEDVDQGDGNVICFGPDLIDPKCLKDRTMGLELDLPKLLDDKNFNKNPCIFFKQKDLMYNHFNSETGHRQSFNIKNEIFKFELKGGKYTHKQTFELIEKGHLLNRIFAVVDNSRLISYNVKEMQKILVLNSFRFFDLLPETHINHIYGLIAELNDNELLEFLSDLGKKMSQACEFNFYGAYKIDLEALLKLHFYDTSYRRNSSRIDEDDITIEMKQLLAELNKGSFESLNVIKQHAPELFKSSRFVDYLLSKIDNPQSIAVIKGLIH